MTSLTSLLILCSSLSAACPADAPDTAFLPPDGFLKSWNKSEKQRLFTAADLYGHINGGAEIFLEFGFEQLTVQSYAQGRTADSQIPAVEINVEIYRMSDSIAATGIYLMNCGRESRDPAFADRHCLSKYQLIFKRNRYYVLIGNNTGQEALRPVMLEFAKHIAAQLPAEQELKIDQLLPKKGLNKSSVRLIRGQYGLQSFFTLGKGNILQLGRDITAISGCYKDDNGEYTLIIADYPTEAAAAAAFKNVRTKLDKYLSVKENAKQRLVFKDANDKYGKVSVNEKRIAVKLHLSSPPD